MRKPTTNPLDVQMSDVVCDFCRAEWTDERPMIEGHEGSCICMQCLEAAYMVVVLEQAGRPSDQKKCTMCLEIRKDPM